MTRNPQGTLNSRGDRRALLCTVHDMLELQTANWAQCNSRPSDPSQPSAPLLRQAPSPEFSPWTGASSRRAGSDPPGEGRRANPGLRSRPSRPRPPRPARPAGWRISDDRPRRSACPMRQHRGPRVFPSLSSDIRHAAPVHGEKAGIGRRIGFCASRPIPAPLPYL